MFSGIPRLAARSLFAFSTAIAISSTFMLGSPLRAQEAVAGPAADDAFIRTVENKEAGNVILQMAIRRFERNGQAGPIVTMHSAIHIADQVFYEKLQKLLDEKDVVLFESVKPPGAGRPEHSLTGADSSEFKIATTKMRLRLLGIAALAFERKNKKLPADMQELLKSVDGKLEMYSNLLAKDGWGNEFLYALLPEPVKDSGENSSATKSKKPGFEIISLGEDKAQGGEGAGADVLLSNQKPISSRDVPKEGDQGIQADLAEALGLVFQLNAMKHDKSNWRNSDLSIDQVQERLAASGADGDELFKMLNGSSMQAGVLKLLLGFMKLMPSLQVSGKLMIIEAMGSADQLMVNMPGANKMMDVILKDRNKVVIDDLANIIQRDPTVKHVGIIYGGAHMPDLEESLQKMGYQETSVEWLDAITVMLPKNPAERQQLESMRSTIRRSIQQQIKQLQKGAEKKKKE
jgi:hypothetical protein